MSSERGKYKLTLVGETAAEGIQLVVAGGLALIFGPKHVRGMDENSGRINAAADLIGESLVTPFNIGRYLVKFDPDILGISPIVEIPDPKGFSADIGRTLDRANHAGFDWVNNFRK